MESWRGPETLVFCSNYRTGTTAINNTISGLWFQCTYSTASYCPIVLIVNSDNIGGYCVSTIFQLYRGGQFY